MKAYENTNLTPRERAEALLGELSLEEKLAQVRGMWGFPKVLAEATPERKMAYEQCYAYGIGHVSTLFERQMKTTEECAQFQRDLQKKIMEKSPHHIPATFHMEGICGPFIQDSTNYPAGIARGASFDPVLEKKIAQKVAAQELTAGITEILAPVLDISRDSRMGRQGEPYGEDPTLASAMGAAFTAGIQETEAAGRHADACAKHFLGFHGSQGGIHGANTDAGDALLLEIYGKPFQAAIRLSNLRGVMPCYNSIAGEPASASKKILHDLLREKMGFSGCVISDYGAVGNIHGVQCVGETAAEAGLQSLICGMDCELPDGEVFGSKEFRELLDVQEKDSPAMQALDRAVENILEAKFRMGLFEHPFAEEGETLARAFNDKEANALSLQSAEESMVLLKNDGILPLAKSLGNGADPAHFTGKGLQIAVIGPHAANARDMFGGYTHLSMAEGAVAAVNSTAGVGESGQLGGDYEKVPGTQIQLDETPEFDAVLKTIAPDCKNLVEALREDLPDAVITWSHGYYIAGDDQSGFAAALEACQDADVVILTLGGKHGTCSIASMAEGVDSTDINLPAAQDAFLEQVKALGKPLVGVHFDGRPISSDVADRTLDAILEAWSPAKFGADAVSRILRGTVNPSGKMPVTTARSAGQIPVYYNHPNGSCWHQGSSVGFPDYVNLPHRPRYYFGQGLSYTTFAYEGLVVSPEKVGPGEQVTVRFTVENTGETPGTETVQLYLKDVVASRTRPVMELAGFARVALRPGEKKEVAFEVAPSQLAFVQPDGSFLTEHGEVRVLVGSSSEDIRLQGNYFVTKDQVIAGRDRAFFAKARITEVSGEGEADGTAV